MTSPLVVGLVRCLDRFDPKISLVALSSEEFTVNLKLTTEDLSLLFGALYKNWTVSAIDLSNHAGASVKHSLNEERPFLKILGSHPFKILELRADGACMRKYDAFLLREYLSFSGSLVRLDISSSSLRAVGASILCDGLKANRTLLHLGLSHNKLDSSSAKFLSDVLKIHPTLFHLDLSNNVIGPVGAMHIGSAFLETPSLGHLKVCCNEIGNDGVFALCEALVYNVTLKFLDVSHNRIDSLDAFECVANSLRGNRELHRLILSGNPLPSSCFDLFGIDPQEFSFNFLDVSGITLSESSLRKFSFGSLVYINVSGCGIGDGGASEISNVIRTNLTLKEISLHDNCITATGAIPLGRALQSNRKLERLSISDNPLGDSGFKIICKSLETNRALLHFHSERCRLHEEATVYLKDMMSKNVCIVELNVGGNAFESLSASSNIAIGLNSNRTLERLFLHECSISSGISQICNALKSNQSLKHLDIFGNEVNNSGCQSIAQLITATQSLVFLDLTNNCFDSDGLAHIARALKTNKSLSHIGLSGNDSIYEMDSLIAALRVNSTLQKVSVKDCGTFGTIFGDSRVCCYLVTSRGEKAFFSDAEPAIFRALSKSVSHFISSSVTAASFFIFQELKLLPQLFAQEDMKFFMHGLSKLFHDRGISYSEVQAMPYSTFRSIIPSKLLISEDQFKLFKSRVRSASVLVVCDNEVSYGPAVHENSESIFHSGIFRGVPVYIQLFRVDARFDTMLPLVQRLVTVRVSGFRNIVNYIAIIRNGDICVGLVIGRVVHSQKDVESFQSMRSLVLNGQQQHLNWMHMYYMCLGAAEGINALVNSPDALPEGWSQEFDNERRACYFHKAGANKTFSRPSVAPSLSILDGPMVTSENLFVDHQYCIQISYLESKILTQDAALRSIRCILYDIACGCSFDDPRDMYQYLFACDGPPELLVTAEASRIPPQFLALLKKCFPVSGPMPSLSSVIDALRVLSKYDASVPAKLPDFCRDFVCVYFQWDDSLPHMSTEQLSSKCSRVGDVSFCRSISSDDFGNKGYVYFDRISTYNLDEIILHCFRRESSSAKASFFHEPSKDPNFSQEFNASAVDGRGTRIGHPGQWRDHSLHQGQQGYLFKYCSSEEAAEGSLCRHGSATITESHWSCCGSKDIRSECTGHRGPKIDFASSGNCSGTCRHQGSKGHSPHWSCCGSDVDVVICPSSAKSMASKGVSKSDVMEPVIRLLPYRSNCLIFGSYALWLFEEARGKKPNWIPGDCDFFCLNVTTDELKRMAESFRLQVKSNLNIDMQLSQINQNLISIDFSGSTIRINEMKISFVRSSFATLEELQATIDISVARVGVRIKPVNGARNFIMPARTKKDVEAGTMSWSMDPYMDTRSPQAQYFTEKLLPRLLKYMQRGYQLNNMETKLTAIDSFIFSYDEKELSAVPVVSVGQVDASEGSDYYGGSDEERRDDTSGSGQEHSGDERHTQWGGSDGSDAASLFRSVQEHSGDGQHIGTYGSDEDDAARSTYSDQEHSGDDYGNSGHDFVVGCNVMLSFDFALYSRANEGPLRPGDVGTLVEDDESNLPFKVEFNGQTWWYDRRALAVVPF